MFAATVKDLRSYLTMYPALLSHVFHKCTYKSPAALHSKIYDHLTSSEEMSTPCTYVVRSHRRRVPSQAPDRANCPSEEMTTSLTK